MRKKRRRANRKYKNRLFLKVFEKKEDILSLYNAVNDSNYENPDDLEITTLDNVLVSKIRENLAKGKTLRWPEVRIFNGIANKISSGGDRNAVDGVR